MTKNKKTIGYIIGGGLKESFRAPLTFPTKCAEGEFVVIENANWRYYGLVTDIQLGTTDRVLRMNKPKGVCPPR